MAQVAYRSSPSRLPTAQGDRVKVLLQAALEDEGRGNLQSAETNLRLATAFAPTDALVKQALDRVVKAREAKRRESNGGR